MRGGLALKAGIWILDTVLRKTVPSGKTLIENGYVNQFRHPKHSGPASGHFKEPSLKRESGVNDNANE
jgi:hypothetical protein